MTATIDHAAFQTLISESADVARLSLEVGVSLETVTQAQTEGFLQIGISEDTAAMLTGLIMAKATEGFEFSAYRAEVLREEIRRNTEAMAGK